MTDEPNYNVAMVMAKAFATRHAWKHDFYKKELAPLALSLGPHPLYLTAVARDDDRLNFAFNLDDAFGEEQDAPPLVRDLVKKIMDDVSTGCPELAAWLAVHPGIERTIEFRSMPPFPPSKPADL
jgi:hypothetical protein